MTVTCTPVDVALLLKEWLKDESGLIDQFPELSIRLELPANWSLGSDPVMVVADDGGPMDFWPVATAPAIRITTWTSGRECKYVYAAMGLLLPPSTIGAVRIPGVAAVLPSTSVLEARDSKNGADLASFTVLTRVRTA